MEYQRFFHIFTPSLIFLGFSLFCLYVLAKWFYMDTVVCFIFNKRDKVLSIFEFRECRCVIMDKISSCRNYHEICQTENIEFRTQVNKLWGE